MNTRALIFIISMHPNRENQEPQCSLHLTTQRPELQAIFFEAAMSPGAGWYRLTRAQMSRWQGWCTTFSWLTFLEMVCMKNRFNLMSMVQLSLSIKFVIENHFYKQLTNLPVSLAGFFLSECCGAFYDPIFFQHIPSFPDLCPLAPRAFRNLAQDYSLGNCYEWKPLKTGRNCPKRGNHLNQPSIFKSENVGFQGNTYKPWVVLLIWVRNRDPSKVQLLIWGSWQ